MSVFFNPTDSFGNRVIINNKLDFECFENELAKVLFIVKQPKCNLFSNILENDANVSTPSLSIPTTATAPLRNSYHQNAFQNVGRIQPEKEEMNEKLKKAIEKAKVEMSTCHAIRSLEIHAEHSDKFMKKIDEGSSSEQIHAKMDEISKCNDGEDRDISLGLINQPEPCDNEKEEISNLQTSSTKTGL